MNSSQGELTENPRLRDARRPRSETTASSLVAIVRAGALQAQLTELWPGLHRAHAGGTAPPQARARRRKNNESVEALCDRL